MKKREQVAVLGGGFSGEAPEVLLQGEVYAEGGAWRWRIVSGDRPSQEQAMIELKAALEGGTIIGGRDHRGRPVERRRGRF